MVTRLTHALGILALCRLVTGLVVSLLSRLSEDLASLKRYLTTPAAPPRRRQWPARLLVEALDCRITPADWTWTGNVSQLWSVGGNWLNDETQQTGVPAPEDRVWFTAGPNGQYNRPCAVDLAAGGTINSLTVSAHYTSTLTLERGLTVTNTEQFGGTIAGSATYQVPSGGTYLWEGGTLRGGGNPNTDLTKIASGATMTISSLATFTVTLDGRALENSGTVVWSGPAAGGIVGTINLVNHAEVQNKASALIDIWPGSEYCMGGDNTALFTNDGAVKVWDTADAGIGIRSDTTGKGSYQVAGLAAVLRFDAGGALTTFTSAKDHIPTILGTGEVRFDGITVVKGTLNVVGATTVVAESGAIFLVAGTINLSPFFLVGAPALELNDNSIVGGTINAQGAVSINGGLELVATTFNTSFQVNWQDGTITLDGGAVVNNSGTWTVASQNPVDVTMTGDQSGTFNNLGTFNQNTPNVTTIATPFTNTGDPIIRVVQVSNGSLAFAGNWENGTATVRLQGGSLVVNGNFTNLGTVHVPNSGTIAALTVTNNGTITLANGGSGTLTIAKVQGQGGNYVQGGMGTLSLDITGDNQNDRLLVTGTTTLGGTLTVSLGGGYVPGNGLTWTLLDSVGAVNGTFAIVNKPQGFNNPIYSANLVTIGN